MRIRNLGYQGIIIGIVDDHQSEVENDFKRHGATAALHNPLTADKLALILSGNVCLFSMFIGNPYF